MPLRILIIYDHFYPAQKAGGIVRSLYNLCEATNDVVEYYIICSCFDYREKMPMPNIQVNQWTSLENNIHIYYTNPEKISINYYRNIFNQISPDIIYLNGIFSYKFNILPLIMFKTNLLQTKIIVAPRGMLQKGAIDSKKLKKKVFFAISKWLGLFAVVQWHATDNQECSDIKNIFVNTKRIWIVPAIPSIYFQSSPSVFLHVKEKTQLKIVTISLIAKKKNHKFALEILSKLSGSVSISYTIYGPIKDSSYWESCLEVMRNAPKNIQIEYFGLLAPEDVEHALSQHHFFLLPTQGENFGHAIFEAMSAGLPVIISDQTPWRNLETQKVGWDIPLSEPERFVAAIERAARMDQAEYEQWSRAAHQYALDFIAKSNLKERYLEMFSTT